MPDDTRADEEALALRDRGRSFVDIAHTLGLEDANAAHAAFVRALLLRPHTEQAWLRSREMARLDSLASRLRQREDLSVEEVVRHLRGVKHQRESLFVP